MAPDPNHPGFQKLTPMESTLCGIVAGTLETTLLQPLLYCKNASQQGLPFSLSPSVLYRGLAVSISNMAILTGLQFPLTAAVQSVFTGGVPRQLSASEQIASGFLGGAMSGVACAPMELVLVQQQRFGKSLLETPEIVLREGGGGSGLMRGLVTSCGREGLFTAGYMGLGPALSQKLRDDPPSFLPAMSGPVAKLWGAIGSGVIAATLSHPLDTVKTCMQGDIQRQKYGTLTQTCKVLYSEGGPLRFFTGWSWRTGRMCCAMAIMSEIRLQLSPLFFPHHFKE